jgi:hypothetical protein
MLDIANSHQGLAQIAQLRNDLVSAQIHTCQAIQWYERSGDLVDAALCLVDLVDTAVAMGDLQRAAWCVGAVDGVFTKYRMLRTETIPGQHQARVESIRSVLGNDDWQSNYDRAFAMSEDEILTEVKSWLGCHKTVGTDPSASGQNTQTDYDDDTR